MNIAAEKWETAEGGGFLVIWQRPSCRCGHLWSLLRDLLPCWSSSSSSSSVRLSARASSTQLYVTTTLTLLFPNNQFIFSFNYSKRHLSKQYHRRRRQVAIWLLGLTCAVLCRLKCCRRHWWAMCVAVETPQLRSFVCFLIQ